MAISPKNPFKGRHYPGDVILTAVRWYLRYPLAYLHVSELLTERGLLVDASCIWRWVQAYAPELNKRGRRHLKPPNKSYRIDETYIKVKGEDRGSVAKFKERAVLRRRWFEFLGIDHRVPRLDYRSHSRNASYAPADVDGDHIARVCYDLPGP